MEEIKEGTIVKRDRGSKHSTVHFSTGCISMKLSTKQLECRQELGDGCKMCAYIICVR